MSRPSNEPVVRSILTALMPAWGSHEVQRIEYLSGGYTNRNYRVEVQGRAYVLRVVEGAKPSPCERDYLALDVAPDVVAYDARHGHLLTRWIAGKVLADSPPSLGEAGEYLADLHARIPVGLNRYDFNREVTAMFRRAGKVDAQVRACFERTAWRPAAWRGCHNDLNPWNIIRAEDTHAGVRFRTLDWESAGDNDPLFDLVFRFRTNVTMPTSSRKPLTQSRRRSAAFENRNIGMGRISVSCGTRCLVTLEAAH